MHGPFSKIYMGGGPPRPPRIDAPAVWNPYCIQAIKALEVWNKLDEGNQNIMFTKK